MTIPVLGAVISGALLACLFALFRYEQKRGRRYAEHVRAAFDRFVVRLDRSISRFSRFVGRRMIRQSIHYLFHRMLTSLLYFLERCEERTKRILRTNRLIARRLSGNGDRPRNILDEIAEHKQSVALSEEEKKKHKQKSLEG